MQLSMTARRLLLENCKHFPLAHPFHHTSHISETGFIKQQRAYSACWNATAIANSNSSYWALLSETRDTGNSEGNWDLLALVMPNSVGDIIIPIPLDNADF